MAKKKTTREGRITVTYHGTPLLDVVRYVHEETVRHCACCGKSMNRSDVNDYGSLCERCYMKEYYDR